MGRINFGHHRRLLLGQDSPVIDSQGDQEYPEEEPGEDTFGEEDFTQTPPPFVQTEYEEAIPQSAMEAVRRLPHIIQEVPRARIQRIGAINATGISQAALLGSGAAGIGISGVAAWLLIGAIPKASSPIAKIGVGIGLAATGLLALHSAIAVAVGLSTSSG